MAAAGRWLDWANSLWPLAGESSPTAKSVDKVKSKSSSDPRKAPAGMLLGFHGTSVQLERFFCQAELTPQNTQLTPLLVDVFVLVFPPSDPPTLRERSGFWSLARSPWGSRHYTFADASPSQGLDEGQPRSCQSFDKLVSMSSRAPSQDGATRSAEMLLVFTRLFS